VEPSEPTDQKRSAGNLAFQIVFGAVLVGSMVTLFVVLTRASDAGRDAIQAYVGAIRGGAPVTPQTAGDEAESVARALRASSSFSISNFQSQQSTSCFWVALRGGPKEVEARFVLADEPKVHVVGASLARRCDCPIDIDQPCHLLPP